MKLNHEILAVLFIAPVVAAIVFRKDFLFIWFQMCINFIFEISTSNLENKEYFALATVLNFLIAIIGLRLNILYFLLFIYQGVFTYLRMCEVLPFSNGYFALGNSLLLCTIIILQNLKGRDNE